MVGGLVALGPQATADVVLQDICGAVQDLVERLPVPRAEVLARHAPQEIVAVVIQVGLMY